MTTMLPRTQAKPQSGLAHGRAVPNRPGAITLSRRTAVHLVVVKHLVSRDTALVAYDLELADRLRELLASEPTVVEKRMFGGLAFMVAGRMAVAASGGGGLLLRVDPAQTEVLVADSRATRFAMRGREMDGWLRVDIDGSASDDDLNRWVRHGVEYARSLPPK